MLLIIATIWLVIFAFLAIYLGHTPKGRGWLRILWNSRNSISSSIRRQSAYG